ncbi:MAG: sulfatase-like hydrolase/transferase, partial [Bacillota bacterium]
QENATFDTPNIDSLAEDGVYMDNFYSSSPVCSPSRFGLLTGRYPSRGYLDRVLLPTDKSMMPYNYQRLTNSFFFRRNVDGILGDEITLAEVVKAYGYNTGLIGKWHLGDYGQYLPTKQGFDYYFGSYYSNDMVPYELVREQNGKAKTVFTHSQMKDQSKTNEIYTEEVLTFINNSLDNDEKFFALYNSPWPHAPHFSGEENDKADDTYIDCITEFDDYLGNIFASLKERGVYDDTLIIFTSDNGSSQQGSTGPLKGKKDTTFEGGHKVPFIARYPNGGLGGGNSFNGLTEPKRVETRAMNIDIFPTVLSYIGIEQLPEDRIIDGRSLFDILQGNIATDIAIHESLYYIKNSEVQAIQKPVTIDGDKVNMKYFESVSSEFVSIFMFMKRKNLLFNLDSDPAEAYNISKKYPNVANEMKEDLRAFIKHLKENRRGKI